MADTLRKPTASLRSENPYSKSETLSRFSIPGVSPDLLNFSSSTCQEDSRSQLVIGRPIISKIGDSASIAFTSHRKMGGSTVSVFDGNLAGRDLFAVSAFPNRTVELYDPPTWRQIFIFALENLDLVLRKGCAIGTWHNRPRHLHILDVVVCISDLQAALELGKCFDQQSVYDLKRRREIAVPYQSPVSVQPVVEVRR